MATIHKLKEEERLPNEFWEDQRWALEHCAELGEQYPDMWIAVLDKEIVAVGPNVSNSGAAARIKSAARPPVRLSVESNTRILS